MAGFGDMLKQLGGISGLMQLASDPSKVLGVGIKAAPNLFDALARMRLAQDCTAHAAMLSCNANRIVTQCLMDKRDATPEEMAVLKEYEARTVEAVQMMVNYARHHAANGTDVRGLAFAYGAAAVAVASVRADDPQRRDDGSGEAQGEGSGAAARKLN